MPTSGRIRIGGAPAQSSKVTYKFGSGSSDFEPVSTTVDASADGRMETIAELDVDDGIANWFGRGSSNNPLQAQGFIGLRLVADAAASQATGSYRIAVRTAQGRRLYNIHEGDLASEDLFEGAAGSGSKKDRKNREPFPNASREWQTEPRKITVDVDVDSDITVDFNEAETELAAEGYRAEALR
jgi:hypothetical protein